VRGVLTALPGVKNVDVKGGDKKVTVSYDPKSVSPTAMIAAMQKAGEPAKQLQ
jgi:copper chaperone CopZ